LKNQHLRNSVGSSMILEWQGGC